MKERMRHRIEKIVIAGGVATGVGGVAIVAETISDQSHLHNAADTLLAAQKIISNDSSIKTSNGKNVSFTLPFSERESLAKEKVVKATKELSDADLTTTTRADLTTVIADLSGQVSEKTIIAKDEVLLFNATNDIKHAASSKDDKAAVKVLIGFGGLGIGIWSGVSALGRKI